MIRGLGNRRLCMSMVRGMGHEHGTWHGFTSHQELGSLISGGGCDVQRVTGVCGWSSVTLGPTFELVTGKRADLGVDGEVYLQNGHGLTDLERAYGAQHIGRSTRQAER